MIPKRSTRANQPGPVLRSPTSDVSDKSPAGPTASGKSPRPLSFLNAVTHSSVQGTDTRGIRGVGAGQAPSRGYHAAGISCSMTSASPRDRIPIPRTPDGALTAVVAWVCCGSRQGVGWEAAVVTGDGGGIGSWCRQHGTCVSFASRAVKGNDTTMPPVPFPSDQPATPS